MLTVSGLRRVGRARQDVRFAAHADDVGRVPSARAFRVIGVDCPPLECRDRIVDEAGLVQRVGVNRDLHIVLVGDAQTAVDGGGSRTPVLVELQTHRACADLFVQPFRPRAVPFAEEPEVHRQRISRLQHPLEIPRSGRARGRLRSGRRSGPAADKRGDAGCQRHVDLLRADVVDVRVNAARRQDQALRRDGLGCCADDHAGGHAGHHIRVARLSDPGDAPVLHTDVGFVDARPINDQRVRDHEIQRAILSGARGLAHAVAKHLASTEFALVSVRRVVALHLGDQIGVGEAHAIAGRRTIDVDVMPAAACDSSQQASADNAVARDLDQRHRLDLTGLETDSGAGWNIQAPAGSGLPIELEGTICLCEMVVTANLNGPVAEVSDLHLNRLPPLVDHDVGSVELNFSGRWLDRCADRAPGAQAGPRRDGQEASVKRQLEIPFGGGDGVVDRHELAPVRERSLDLHLDDHFRDVIHHIAATQYLPAQIHQLCHRAPITDELEHLRADQRDGFGVIQPEAAREPLLREMTGLVQCKLVELMRRKMHDHHFLLHGSSPSSGGRKSRESRMRPPHLLHTRAGHPQQHAAVTQRRSGQHQVGIPRNRLDPRSNPAPSLHRRDTNGPVTTAVRNTSKRPILSAIESRSCSRTSASLNTGRPSREMATRLSYRENAQRSPAACRPDVIQSTTTRLASPRSS